MSSSGQFRGSCRSSSLGRWTADIGAGGHHIAKEQIGSLNKEERYRSELKARRRRRGESLQAVYKDIRRLMALAFPGQTGPLLLFYYATNAAHKKHTITMSKKRNKSIPYIT